MSQSLWKNEQFCRLSLEKMDERFLTGAGQEVDFLVEALHLRTGQRVLDLGCGAGRHAIPLAARGLAVTALDISPFMLEQAKGRALQAGVEVTWMQADLGKLGELGLAGPFDAAICLCESGLGVLGGHNQDMQFLRDARAVLAPGGSLALTTFNGIRRYLQYGPGSVFDISLGILHWEGPPDDSGRPLCEDQRQYVPSELAMLFHVAGFSEVRVIGCSAGDFRERPLRVDDIEMMVIATA